MSLVSMKSGLRDRNNLVNLGAVCGNDMSQ